MRGYEMAFVMIEKAKTFVHAGVEPVEPASIGGAVVKYAPEILGILRDGLGMMAAGRMQPQPIQRQAQPVNVTPAETKKEEGEPVRLPINEEEAEQIRPIVAVLHQYGPNLIGFLKRPDTTPDVLATQLVGLMGPDLDESMLALSDIATRTGPQLLTVIHPEAGTTKALETIQACARKIRESENV